MVFAFVGFRVVVFDAIAVVVVVDNERVVIEVLLVERVEIDGREGLIGAAVPFVNEDPVVKGAPVAVTFPIVALAIGERLIKGRLAVKSRGALFSF